MGQVVFRKGSWSCSVSDVGFLFSVVKLFSSYICCYDFFVVFGDLLEDRKYSVVYEKLV